MSIVIIVFHKYLKFITRADYCDSNFIFIEKTQRQQQRAALALNFTAKIYVYIFLRINPAHYPDVFIQITTMSIRLIWLSLQINVDEFVVHLDLHEIHVFERLLLCCAYEKPFNIRKRLLENADELRHIEMKWRTLAYEIRG